MIIAVALLGMVAVVSALALHQTRSLRLPRRALLAGNPRRSRALARVFARECAPHERVALALSEAKALLWEGELTRAIALLDARVIPAHDPSLGVRPIIIKLECLVFDERFDEAESLFTAHGDALRASRRDRADVGAISAFLRFQRDDLDGAQLELDTSVCLAPTRDPIRRAMHFGLAAIAHRRGLHDDARRQLAQTMRGGGELFVARWAAAQWETLFPREAMPSRNAPRARVLRTPRMLRGLPRNLWIGLNVLFFRTAELRGRRFAADQVGALVLLDLFLVGALRFVDYRANADFFASGLLTVAAPVLFFLLTAHLATRHKADRHAALQLLAGFYGALPVVLIAVFIAIDRQPRFASGPLPFELIAGGWLVAVVLRLIHSIVRGAGVVRLLACAVVFGATWLLPMFVVARTVVFFAPMKGFDDFETQERQHDELVFAEADKLLAAERSLLGERPGVTDLYFVGAAGWAHEDVFGRELRAARQLFDDRFDTAGRSIILANDDAGRELPLTSAPSLRHVLKAVGALMNRQEDVLFLFVTSHGSRQGIAIRPPPDAAFRSDTVSPEGLRSMLDVSRIKWRVLVISGCESGVFIGPLQNEHTLVATAAAGDRNSYGCAMGNPFTDYGRALFGEQLAHEGSFLTAFTNAAELVEKREVQNNLRASRPQISEGSAIRGKLRELELRLAGSARK